MLEPLAQPKRYLFEEFLTSSEKLRPLGFYFLILSSMICFCNPTPGARNLMKSAWRSRNIPWYPQNLFNKFPWSRMILFSVIFRIFWSPRSPLTLFNSTPGQLSWPKRYLLQPLRCLNALWCLWKPFCHQEF